MLPVTPLDVIPAVFPVMRVAPEFRLNTAVVPLTTNVPQFRVAEDSTDKLEEADAAIGKSELSWSVFVLDPVPTFQANMPIPAAIEENV